MNATQTQADEAQVVELEPVIVAARAFGRVMAAYRRADIYFQFGPRHGGVITLFVLPADADAAQAIADSQLIAAGAGLALRPLAAAAAVLAIVALAAALMMIANGF